MDFPFISYQWFQSHNQKMWWWFPMSWTLFSKDEQWEDKCTDSWGYSWCSPKTYPCPITCAEDQQAWKNGAGGWSIHYLTRTVSLSNMFKLRFLSDIKWELKDRSVMYHYYFSRILPNAIFFLVAIYESMFMAPDVQSPNWESQVCYSTVYLETGEPDWSAAGNQILGQDNAWHGVDVYHKHIFAIDCSRRLGLFENGGYPKLLFFNEKMIIH